MQTLAEGLGGRTTSRLVEGRDGVLSTAQALGQHAPVTGGEHCAVSYRDTRELVRALVALDGVAGTLLVLSDHLPPAEVERSMAEAHCATLFSDRTDLPDAVRLDAGGPGPRARDAQTSWVLATSGTTGRPTLVRHTLATLSRTVRKGEGALTGARWGLVYDPARFAGLQVVLQAVLGDGTLLRSSAGQVAAQVDELAALGCDHLSATPSQWRRLLMHPRARDLPLRRVTLGGEAADDPLLRALAAAFPAARISHVYAATEIGVGFTVTDGLAGFPEAYLTPGDLTGVDLKITDGVLWVRVADDHRSAPRDAEGFVCSGDAVERRDGRVRFLGRAGSAVSVGGVLVHPEEVERVLLGHPHVRLCRVSARPNALTGALLEADVVGDDAVDPEELRRALVALCRQALPREAVPRRIRMTDDLTLSAAGKMAR